MPGNRLVIIFIMLWLGAIGAGLGVLSSYGSAPGAFGAAPQRWPSDASLTLDPDRPTLLLAVHPRCPCTRSTIEELAGVLGESRRRPRTMALIFEPASDARNDESERFARTAISGSLSRLPDVELVPDPGSEIAACFGALTSGHALLYSPQGELLFSGGLTPTRAHVGPNTGSAALGALLAGDTPISSRAPVYGCPLCEGGPGAVCLQPEESEP